MGDAAAQAMLLDATGQAELVRQRVIRPDELVEAAIRQIEAFNPTVNAVIHPRFDQAMTEARQSPPEPRPFEGVPLLVKDLHCQERGQPYHAGMAVLKKQDWKGDTDSFFLQRLRQAGFICVGRTNTSELGILPSTEPAAYGATRNPWLMERSAGGSSGGSAAAVAAGMTAVAHGNDAGGSLRIPASACGLIGLKPSRGRTSLGPTMGESAGGLLTEGVLTRTVRDCASVLDAVAGYMPGDPYTAPIPPHGFAAHLADPLSALRIAVVTDIPGTARVDPECSNAVAKVAEVLRERGHTLVSDRPSELGETDFLKHFVVLHAARVQQVLHGWSGAIAAPLGQNDVEPTTWALAELGKQYSACQLIDALHWLQQYSRRLAASWLDRWDLLLTPTMPSLPPALGCIDSHDKDPVAVLLKAGSLVTFLTPFNVSGQPAVSLPAMISADGLPIGVQIVGRYGSEDVLLQVARQLEQEIGWSQWRSRAEDYSEEGRYLIRPSLPRS